MTKLFAKIGLLCALAQVMAACSPNPRPLAEIRAQFDLNRDVYSELRGMICDDIASRREFTVGFDLIGDYWKHNDLWEMDGAVQGVRDPEPRKLVEVLQRVGITTERYQRYRVLLEKAGAERASALSKESGGEVSFLIDRSGFAVHGCSTEIFWRTAGAPEVPSWAKSHESASFDKDWFLLSVCS
jgi:hypothetical protein